jgi:hypothetical protein
MIRNGWRLGDKEKAAQVRNQFRERKGSEENDRQQIYDRQRIRHAKQCSAEMRHATAVAIRPAAPAK